MTFTRPLCKLRSNLSGDRNETLVRDFFTLLFTNTSLANREVCVFSGINGYQNNISPLRFCVSDIKALREVLIDLQIGAFKAANALLMTDDSTGIDRSTGRNTVAKLERLSRCIQTGDPFIFVHAGRGINREQKSFPLAINSDSRSTRMLEKSTVLLEMVSEILSEIRASQTLTIIDACRNDPSSGRGDQDNALTSPNSPVESGWSKQEQPRPNPQRQPRCMQYRGAGL